MATLTASSSLSKHTPHQKKQQQSPTKTTNGPSATTTTSPPQTSYRIRSSDFHASSPSRSRSAPVPTTTGTRTSITALPTMTTCLHKLPYLSPEDAQPLIAHNSSPRSDENVRESMVRFLITLILLFLFLRGVDEELLIQTVPLFLLYGSLIMIVFVIALWFRLGMMLICLRCQIRHANANLSTPLFFFSVLSIRIIYYAYGHRYPPRRWCSRTPPPNSLLSISELLRHFPNQPSFSSGLLSYSTHTHTKH